MLCGSCAWSCSATCQAVAAVLSQAGPNNNSLDRWRLTARPIAVRKGHAFPPPGRLDNLIRAADCIAIEAARMRGSCLRLVRKGSAFLYCKERRRVIPNDPSLIWAALILKRRWDGAIEDDTGPFSYATSFVFIFTFNPADTPHWGEMWRSC